MLQPPEVLPKPIAREAAAPQPPVRVHLAERIEQPAPLAPVAAFQPAAVQPRKSATNPAPNAAAASLLETGPALALPQIKEPAVAPSDPASETPPTPAVAPEPTKAVTEATAPAAQPQSARPVAEAALNLAVEAEWLDQLARDIAGTAGGDGSPLRFRLNPEHLGALHVEISTDRGATAVRLTADTEAARSLIADAQPRLLAEARAQGVRISETTVDLGSQQGSGDARRHAEIFRETPVRTARLLHEDEPNDGIPTPVTSERYA